VLERLFFKEVKRAERGGGVFPNETSASTLATEIALRSSEEWALKRYLYIDAHHEAEKPNPHYGSRWLILTRKLIMCHYWVREAANLGDFWG